jgi:hypothetical protein
LAAADQFVHQAPPDPETLGRLLDAEQQSVVGAEGEIDDLVSIGAS